MNDEIEKIEEEIKKIEKTIAEKKAKGAVGVKKAVKLLNDDKPVGMITLWEDGHVTACITSPDNPVMGGCYTAKDKDGKMFYYMQAWFAGISKNIKIKPIKEEEK